MSIRATGRITGASKTTILKLLFELGSACTTYMSEKFVNLDMRRIECDEIWSFCVAKSKNVPKERKEEWGVGDIWTWTCVDPDSRLVVTWFVGKRDGLCAAIFMDDVARRMKRRVQVSTDAHWSYAKSIGWAFKGGADHGIVEKVYGRKDGKGPMQCIAVMKGKGVGNPEEALTSTAKVERQNLAMRQGMRRYTRETNGHSKKIENHEAALGLHFAHANFCRVNPGLGTTPAMAAGIESHVWTLEDLVGLLA